MSARSSRRRVVLVNCLARHDELRNAQCDGLAFHVAASAAMENDARRIAASHDGAAGATVELWHASLERFGAGQLNDRFRARFRKPMDSAAWAGWFAVKVVWEASQRARVVAGDAIASFLERDTTAFDGHKGVPLSFRRWDHQLRQPLYVVDSPASRTAVVTTVPTDPAPLRASLDALGTTAETTSCQW